MGLCTSGIISKKNTSLIVNITGAGKQLDRSHKTNTDNTFKKSMVIRFPETVAAGFGWREVEGERLAGQSQAVEDQNDMYIPG